MKAGDFIFVTGQMPTLPDDPTKVIDGGVEAQTHQVMKNLKLVLDSQGLSFERVVFAARSWSTSSFDRMNEVYEPYFQPDALPARTCIGVTGLAVGALVEIDFVVAV